jgi:hypothetical protein
MNTDELALIVSLGASNLALGIGMGVYLARKLSRLTNPPFPLRRSYILILGMYVLECLALPAGMATQVFTIGLAFFWGILLGRWLRRQLPIPSLAYSTEIALYTCLPTITFGVIVPIAWVLSGNSPFSAAAGISFGIPEWVPWPLTTVAGFATAVVLGTVLFKLVIIVGEVSTILHLTQHPDANKHSHA